MKSHDILLLLKLVTLSSGDRPTLIPWDPEKGWDEGLSRPASLKIMTPDVSNVYSVRALAKSTGISKSQVSLSLQRCYDVGLAKPDRYTGVPMPNTKALLEFIMYGLRYVFPAKPGEITRGIPTAWAAPVFKNKMFSAGDLVPVWPDPEGNMKGQAITPLAGSVTEAIKDDSHLYALLALTDAMRIGQARERHLAADKLSKLMLT